MLFNNLFRFYRFSDLALLMSYAITYFISNQQ